MYLSIHCYFKLYRNEEAGVLYSDPFNLSVITDLHCPIKNYLNYQIFIVIAIASTTVFCLLQC